MSSSRQSCYHSRMNPLAVLAVLILVAISAYGHEKVENVADTKCGRTCVQTYDRKLFSLPRAFGPSVAMFCEGDIGHLPGEKSKMNEENCKNWCNDCRKEFGENYPYVGANSPAKITYWQWTWYGLCDCRVFVGNSPEDSGQ
eukprot:Nk52_evm5s586 gene=Nk52_evmTU5s586